MVAAPDLLFGARIAETARAAGIETLPIAAADLPAACRERAPDLVVIDLAAPGDPARWIRALKSDAATAAIPVLGFYPHVRGDLRAAAEAAGADRILPRSAFVARLAALLAGAEGPPAADGATLRGRTVAAGHRPQPVPAMTPESTPSAAVERVRISCPGCGRNDHVSWPAGQAVYHWKCFNCGKEFDLTRDGGH